MNRVIFPDDIILQGNMSSFCRENISTDLSI